MAVVFELTDENSYEVTGYLIVNDEKTLKGKKTFTIELEPDEPTFEGKIQNIKSKLREAIRLLDFI